MTRRRVARALAALLAASATVVAPVASSAAERGSAAGPAEIRMEHLEVRGLLEKPGPLYAPVPKANLRARKAGFDLLLRDLSRPIGAREIRELLSEREGGS